MCNPYYVLCPDYAGVGDRSLSFVRNLSNSSPPRFTLQPAGVHRLSNFHGKLNELLPLNLKNVHATGHSGRHTTASIALNEGVDPIVIGKSTKHKDIRMISQYAHCDEVTKMETAKAVALAGGHKRKFDGNV